MTNSNNPLMDINTSFADYLVERTRSYQEHVVGGTLDYAFDGDFAIRQKINGNSNWSRLLKNISSVDAPALFKEYMQSGETAGSMKFARVYDAAKKCSERLQISIPVILVIKQGEVPEILSIAGDGFDPCIVMSSDIADGLNHDELCFVIGSECGRLQNRHSAFNHAFTYPGISRGDSAGPGVTDISKNGIRELNYMLNKWLLSGDITADRAGIICLDKPSDFPEIYSSVRKKGLPDSMGIQNPHINLEEILNHYETLHITPVRELRINPACSADERRIIAGMEFVGCEVLYIWRSDIPRSGSHMGSKQSLEIRCDILADIEGTRCE